MFSWFKDFRRRRLLAKPFPESWLKYITSNVEHYKNLNDREQAKVRDDLRIVIAENHWEGCEGLEITDEIKVTIAAQASLLLLGIEPGYYFDRVQTILVYPSAFKRSGRSQNGFLVNTSNQETLGEAWHGGPIVLSWPDVLAGGRNANDGRNLVLHEFAHHLDGLDGEMGGSPPIANPREQQKWHRVTEREFKRLSDAAQRGKATLLDHYGASNQAEFFAVSTECFFERSCELREQHPDLYSILKSFYRQDPNARKR